MRKINFKNAIRKGEHGNVLFLILIAVALFAALSYAVTQSTRSGGGDAGKETSKISSAQLTQYPAGIRTALVRMIIGGQNVDTLEFNAPADFGTDGSDGCTEYPDTPENENFPRCVFYPTGGGATYIAPSQDLVANATAWHFNAENEINLVGTSTSTDASSVSTADLIAFLPDITLSVCESINDELGIVGIPTEVGILFTSAEDMVNLGNDPTSITGTGATIGMPTGTDVDRLDGQPFGCFQQPAGTYVYYHVLIER